MAPLIPIAMALAELAPAAMRFFGAGEKSAAVAERMVDIAQQVTGASTPEEALQRLQIDAKLQHDFNMAVMARDAELEKAYLADRQNARARDVEFIKAGKNNVRGDMLAYGALGLLGVTILAVVFTDVSGSAENLMFTLIGALTMIVKDVYSFEFGSSKDGARSQKILSDIAQSE